MADYSTDSSIIVIFTCFPLFRVSSSSSSGENSNVALHYGTYEQSLYKIRGIIFDRDLVMNNAQFRFSIPEKSRREIIRYVEDA